MKKMTKKLGAVVLALALCMSLCCTALAAETQTYSSSTDTSFTITVDPAYSEETYTAYKIFDVTYSDADSDGNISYSYTIDSSSAWYSTVAAATDVFTLSQINGSTTYIVTVNDGVDDDKIIAVFTEEGVPTGAVAAATGTAQKVVDSETGESGKTTVTLNVTSSGAGYYFVTTSLGSVVSIDTTNPSATIEDKNPVPTLTKEVTNESHTGTYEDSTTAGEGKEDTAKVGDILEFEITISNAAHKSALCLHDYTQDGLTYYGSEHISVYLNSVSASNKVSSDWYTIQDGEACEDENCDFEIVFDAEWLDDLSDNDVIIITYEAVVNESAATVNLNDAFLTYGVGGHSVTVETVTDVFGLGLEKIDGDNNLLNGATFTLAYGDSFGTTLSGTLVEFYYDATSNTYTVHDTIDEEYAGEETTNNILVGSTNIFGLDAGTYILTETVAPDGYNKLTSTVTVTISDEGIISITGNSQASLSGDLITVVNNEGSILPGTGGMGTTIFYIIGGVLVVGAVVVLVTRRRMTRGED